MTENQDQPQTVTLTCEIQGDIQWRYSWMIKDGSVIKDSTERVIDINIISVSDGGEYSCEATRSDSTRSDFSDGVTVTESGESSYSTVLLI